MLWLKSRILSILIGLVVLLFAGLLIYSIGQPDGFQEGKATINKPIKPQVKAIQQKTEKKVTIKPPPPKVTPKPKK